MVFEVLSAVAVGFIPNVALAPNEIGGFEFIDGVDIGANDLVGLLAPNPNEGILGVVVVVEVGTKLLKLLVPNAGAVDIVVGVVVVDTGTKLLKLLLPNAGTTDVVVVDGNVELLELEKELGAGNIGIDAAAVVVVGADVVDEEPKLGAVEILVVTDEIEEVGENVNGLVGLNEPVDITGVPVVIDDLGLAPNCPKDIDVDVGILDVVVITEGIEELETAVVRFVDDVEGKGWNGVPPLKRTGCTNCCYCTEYKWSTGSDRIFFSCCR